MTAVQALGHLTTYTIILWDCLKEVPSPHTDDYIFWVKGATKTGELLLAVVVVGGGFYESYLDTDEEWSVMNSVVLMSHCYFNIYTRVSQAEKINIEKFYVLKCTRSTLYQVAH